MSLLNLTKLIFFLLKKKQRRRRINDNRNKSKLCIHLYHLLILILLQQNQVLHSMMYLILLFLIQINLSQMMKKQLLQKEKRMILQAQNLIYQMMIQIQTLIRNFYLISWTKHSLYFLNSLFHYCNKTLNSTSLTAVLTAFSLIILLMFAWNLWKILLKCFNLILHLYIVHSCLLLSIVHNNTYRKEMNKQTAVFWQSYFSLWILSFIIQLLLHLQKFLICKHMLSKSTRTAVLH